MPANNQLGVGDIVMSPLNLTQFRAEHGGNPNEWVLCDGGRYPGSRYQAIMGRDDVPDFRSRYPRGSDSNHGVLTMLEPAYKIIRINCQAGR
jgi:hypothetical protein